jgi:hypothetical protein
MVAVAAPMIVIKARNLVARCRNLWRMLLTVPDLPQSERWLFN